MTQTGSIIWCSGLSTLMPVLMRGAARSCHFHLVLHLHYTPTIRSSPHISSGEKQWMSSDHQRKLKEALFQVNLPKPQR